MLGVTRSVATLCCAVAATPSVALALQEAEHGTSGGGSALLSPNTGLMFWTVLIFFVLFFILKRFAFPPIIDAVHKREQALEQAIEGAKRDREEAARLMEEQRRQIDAARAEAQKIIADGRAVSEKMRNDLLAQTKEQQAELLERARKDIENEKAKAIYELRKEAVDLAIAGASKVIERNLDEQENRRLVDTFLSSIPARPVKR